MYIYIYTHMHIYSIHPSIRTCMHAYMCIRVPLSRPISRPILGSWRSGPVPILSAVFGSPPWNRGASAWLPHWSIGHGGFSRAFWQANLGGSDAKKRTKIIYRSDFRRWKWNITQTHIFDQETMIDHWLQGYTIFSQSHMFFGSVGLPK